MTPGEKDAEIERLKDLVTELADALTWWINESEDETSDFRESIARTDTKLVQRAREASEPHTRLQE